MKMVEYVNVQLKTLPSVSVRILKGYEEKAEQLIAMAISKSENLPNLTNTIKFPYLKNPGILSKTAGLAVENNPVEAGKLQDAILLRMGIYANTPLMRSSDPEERKKALEVDSELIRIVEAIEDNQPLKVGALIRRRK